MSSDDSGALNVYPPSIFSGALRELCLLDDDTLLFCLEGDRDVYQVKVSDLKESSQENPGKLFCKVPYFGIPVFVKGGKAGRLVVVVPTDLNENAEKIEEWVAAIDSLSQASIPAPVKGTWTAAAAHKDNIFLISKSDDFPFQQKLFVAPSPQSFMLGPATPESHPNPYKCILLPPGNNRLVAGGDGSLPIFYNDAGMWGVTVRSETDLTFSSPSTNLGITSAALVVAGGLAGGTYLIVRTASGEIQITEGSASSTTWKSESEEGAENPKISTIALLPDRSLVFSQGKKLFISTSRFLQAKWPDVPMPLPAMSAMRRVVFAGGEGADI
uniref:Uncharacterized protein n=1 Tax=Chromera velia CCMP2878 TaxID=1169474 RepID=A0A0G4IBI4_9ALVE|eukprot:Cvel_2160.t1-p1 / transcript=Cvel_2160.t1 / gene=Cvel_2160 / organism=Chromera_velia_CCMP2878 / gene_product=hypothetical protein / transcript_product=hypothetical protein / location=Cvel_scaffold84:1148-2128(+) / protein_length=327 / sequence_SO=supercontig / SO=protein_coding / is_pseudo=false